MLNRSEDRTKCPNCITLDDDDDIIYLFRMAQLNTVHIKIYTRFLFSEVLIHTIVQSCNIRKYKINIKNIKNVKYMT